MEISNLTNYAKHELNEYNNESSLENSWSHSLNLEQTNPLE